MQLSGHDTCHASILQRCLVFITNVNGSRNEANQSWQEQLFTTVTHPAGPDSPAKTWPEDTPPPPRTPRHSPAGGGGGGGVTAHLS